MNKAPNIFTTRTLPATGHRTFFELFGSIFRAAYHPIPVPRPEIDPNLTELQAIERIVEVIRYQIMQLEYALSSGGGLRAYIKLNFLACVLLGIPAIFVVPIITFFLGAFLTWSAFLLQIALNIFNTLLTIAAIVAVILLLVYFLGRRC